MMKANQFAKQLLERAKIHEPSITKDMSQIAPLIKATIVGLAHRFKSEESLTRKLHDKFYSSKIPLQSLAKRNNDTLRYTYLLAENDYAIGLNAVEKQLMERNYKVSKIFNAWKFAETNQDSGYRGINITVISSQNQKFELQLHTKESFDLKTETHGLYEEFRNPKTSEIRKAEISDIVREKAKKLIRPRGI